MEKENIVKKTCKELGITQKELAARIRVHEETVSKWSRGVIDTPEWAIELFKLLKLEQKYNTLKQIFADELNK
ncbi:MAG: helix-turn-helix transcriptional regulator [Campylobacteraceae bacterium]|jgi:transcriptional regulator with XRE-family HTH domain|nr:helix-turn-helix transcriptional regulator [Campylobacteraceae bacterium]